MKNSLGNKLINLRKQNKMTQEQVADKLEVTRQTISNWELNQTKPDIEQLKSISYLYKLSIDELLDNDVKELLTEKISNVEKLTGLVYKIMIGLLILLGISIIVFIKNKIFYVEFYGVSGSHIYCNLDGQSYEITLTSEKVYGNNIVLDDEIPINNVDVYPYLSIPDLEKYNKSYQIRNVIFNYFKSNGGSCY